MAHTEETEEAWTLSPGLCFVWCGIGPGDQGAACVPPAANVRPSPLFFVSKTKQKDSPVPERWGREVACLRGGISPRRARR